MPSPRGHERGVRNPFSVRVGIDIEKFRGTNTQGDPGAIRDDQFQALENVSHDGSRWDSRDGQSKVNSAAAMSGCVYGQWDDDDGLGFGGGPVRVYGGAPTAGGPIYAYDSELATPSQQFKQNPFETTNSVNVVIAVHEEFAAFRLGAVAEDETAEENLSTRLFVGGQSGRLYEWGPTSPPEGRTLLDTATYPKHILTIPGLTGGLIASLAWWDGILYILAADGSNNVVYSYDGETLTLEDTVVAGGDGVLGVYQGSIVAAHSTTSTQPVRIRSSAGVWSTPGISGLSEPDVDVYDAKEYGTKFYIAVATSGGDGEIWSWDGTSLVVARTPSPDSGDAFVVALEVFNGELAFVWGAEAGGGPS